MELFYGNEPYHYHPERLMKNSIHRKRHVSLGLIELIAIALGGMVGGGIFTVLGISASMIGVYTPVAIFLGGLLATLAAYSYCKLGVYFKDEGATYNFGSINRKSFGKSYQKPREV